MNMEDNVTKLHLEEVRTMKVLLCSYTRKKNHNFFFYDRFEEN